jgi:hypothetical protein
MRKLLRLVAGVLLGSSALAAMPALAQTPLQQDMAMQDMGTMMVGETVISVGGGLAYLTLPDVNLHVVPEDMPTEIAVFAEDQGGRGISGSDCVGRHSRRLPSATSGKGSEQDRDPSGPPDAASGRLSTAERRGGMKR